MAVIKTIGFLGVSTSSWRDAAEKVLQEAGRTLSNTEGSDVVDSSAVVADNATSESHTHTRIRLRLDR